MPHTTHRLHALRRALRTLTTPRLDGRSALAVAVRRWKAAVRADLGGELTAAQETLLELAAQTWLLVTSVDAWLARQPALVTKQRRLLPALLERQRLADSLTRMLEKLGLERRAREVDLAAELAALHRPSPTRRGSA